MLFMINILFYHIIYFYYIYNSFQGLQKKRRGSLDNNTRKSTEHFRRSSWSGNRRTDIIDENKTEDIIMDQTFGKYNYTLFLYNFFNHY